LPEQVVALDCGVHPQTFAVPPPPQVCGDTQLLAQTTFCPQLLTTLPHFAPFWQVCADVWGLHPQTPVMPPPPQLWPVPEQVVEHWTILPQLFAVGPHLPDEQVVVIGSSVQVLQSPVAAAHPNVHAMSAPH
jgi:hypothetical protein